MTTVCCRGSTPCDHSTTRRTMNCHEFLEWTDSLSETDWHDMMADVFHDVTRCAALAYLMKSTPTTSNIFLRVQSRAQADIDQAREERKLGARVS